MSAAVQMELVPVAPLWATTWGTLTDRQRAEHRRRWIERLTPVMRQLAKRHRSEGITASEVLTEGIIAGVLWGEDAFIERYPRVYAWIGPWLSKVAREGKLVPRMIDIPGGGKVQLTRASTRDGSHSNRNAVYLDPEYA